MANFVAVTACATGVAHTYMAKAALEKAAKSMGHTIKVETQGAMGIENEIKPKEVEAADAVIFAVDMAVEKRARFENKKIVEVGTGAAMKQPKAVIEKALS